MLDKLTKESFADCLGGKFRLHYGAADSLEVELIEATGFPARPGKGGQPARRAPFALVFRGPRQPVLPQRIYRIEHAKLGTLELFLVPIGPDGTGMRYEAIFN